VTPVTPVILFVESNTTGTGLLFFQRAKDQGFDPVLVTTEPRRYDFLKAYQFVKIDECSASAVLAIAHQLGKEIAGVWSSSDRGTLVAAEVAMRLGRSGADPTAVAVCRDKYRTRQLLAERGLSRIAFAIARNGEEAAQFAGRVGQPVVVKPRASTGSMGVRLCLNPEEATKHTEKLLRNVEVDVSSGVLIEPYIVGPEYSVELFDGHAIGVTRKHLGPLPAFVELGHDFPAPGPRPVLDRVASFAEQAVGAVGLTAGPAHAEIRVETEGPCVIEVNPRLAGGLIPELVRRAFGLDLISTSISFACGRRYSLASPRLAASSIRFLVRPEGQSIRSVSGLPVVRRLPGAVEAEVLKQGLMREGPVADFRDRLAYVISEAATPEEASLIADRAIAQLRPVPTADEPEVGHG
jgi:S-sulfo-L-cysteine synthase (3-phospho-L-serine-dependent)